MEAAKLRLLVAQRINVGVLVRNYVVHVLVEHPDFDMLKILQIIQIVVGANYVRYWPLGWDPQPHFAPMLPVAPVSSSCCCAKKRRSDCQAM